MTKPCDVRGCESLAAKWALVRVTTHGAVNSFCCEAIDTDWTNVCDDHVREAVELARPLHVGEQFGVNIPLEELR